MAADKTHVKATRQLKFIPDSRFVCHRTRESTKLAVRRKKKLKTARIPVHKRKKSLFLKKLFLQVYIKDILLYNFFKELYMWTFMKYKE